MELEKRVVELELRFTEQQELLTQLNEVLIAHQRELDDFRRAFAQLSKKVDVIPGQVDASASEKPPHY